MSRFDWLRSEAVTLSRSGDPFERPHVPGVECRRCNSKGMHAMPTAYAKAWLLLTSTWQRGPDLLARAGKVRQTAFANRLAWLRAEGFAECRQADDNHRVLEWRRK